ncbi:MAG: hypothetical protein Q4G45_05715 [Actinomycetia bacterium]|nr:hypothetical protein [Actinomycetes bacterium]
MNLGDIYERLSQLAKNAGPVEPGPPVQAGACVEESDDGAVEVEVEDGIITMLRVMDLDPDLAETIRGTINQALKANQAAVLAEARRASPSYDRLMTIVDETSADIQEALRRAVSQAAR